MKKALLIGAAPIYNFNILKGILDINNYSLTVAVDGGYNHLERLNINADLLITDLDSIKNEHLNNLKYLNTKEIYKYNSDKNETDMLISARLLSKRGINKVDIIGATNGRFDHTLANLRVINFLKEESINARLIDEINIISILEDEEVNLKYNGDFYVSFFTFSDFCVLTIKNLKYELDDYNLYPYDLVAVSNEFKNGEVGHIKVKGKVIMVISSKIEHL